MLISGKLGTGRPSIKHVIWIFCIALFVRSIYVYIFVESSYFLSEDQTLYIQLAYQFQSSDFLGVTPQRVPGYPLFLSTIFSVAGKGLWNVVFIQILLDSISCVVIALLAKSIFGRGFWIAGVLSAINLNMVVLSATLLTDTLFLFLFVLFLFSLFQYLKTKSIKWFFFLVLFITLATLVRAVSYYLLPILLIAILSWRFWQKDSGLKIIKLTVLYLSVVGILLGGIHQRNYQQYGSTAFVSQTGAAVLGWIVPAVYQYSGQGSYQQGQKLARSKLNLALQRDHLEGLSSNPFVSSNYQTNIGKEILFELGFVKVLKAWTIGSVINILSPSVAYSPALRSMKHPSFYEAGGNGVFEKLLNYIKNSDEFSYLLILSVGTIISIIFTIMALLGAFKMTSMFPFITVATLLVLVGYFLAITGPIIGVKYRLPIEPILILFVTHFLSEYFSNKSKSLKSSDSI